ncbi:hypothetical protein MNBD_GAMMA09-1293 [hydrothermal vent metagenome]|uniref:Ice-binding protein C-terminal domain-containing protein n=1 Tax=hydrothermal vent metagenome TaxID=652676 RepID=A0A3B0Y6Y2_9ZZZZ
MKYRRLIAGFTMVFVLLVPASGWAVSLIVNNGQLMGAKDVSVSGVLYNVSFQDGTCINLFNGCDQASDFVFNTEAMARVAGQALLDTVFIDVPEGAFDTVPKRTNGIRWDYDGIVQMPVSPINAQSVLVLKLIHSRFEASDQIQGLATFPISSDLTLSDITTFAVWSPVSQVPIPASIWLFGSGLFGLVFAVRRKF